MSPTSPSLTVYWPLTSGKMRQTMYISTPEMAAVTRNVAIVVPMILPARFMFFMLAIAELMEQNTIGTTTQNIILTKRVPRNSIFRPKAGQIPPTMQPSTIPVSMQTINQLFFRNFM